MSQFVFASVPVTGIPVEGSDKLIPVHRVYCVGRNYGDHVIEMGGNPEREPPFFFTKPADAIVSPPSNQPLKRIQVPYPSFTRNLHYECELVVVLEKGGSDIPVERAIEHVYGYAVGIDLTRRDLQNLAKKEKRPWDTSKGFDFSGPVGHIVPKHRVSGGINHAMMTLELNGEVRQKSNLNKMIWSSTEIISKLSEQFDLKPGDVIFTGTPAGVGAIVPGDVCVCEIEGLPKLTVQITPRARL